MRIEHLTKRYRTVTAVDGLSFEVGPGRGHRFLGPNGAAYCLPAPSPAGSRLVVLAVGPGES
jgi:hypothetical protein